MFDTEILVPPEADDTPSAVAETPLDAYSRVVGEVADRVGPAVVRVQSRGKGAGAAAWARA
jgi:hypothetical protein